jgi:argininosuccinate lyase
MLPSLEREKKDWNYRTPHLGPVDAKLGRQAGRRVLYNSATMPKNTPSPAPDSSHDQFANKAKAWSARFSEPVSDLVKRYTASVGFDQRMAHCDIDGSLAHADMLAAVGVISTDDLAAIQRGMARIRQEIDNGDFRWSLDLEDVHLNIEKRLVELIGDAGKRLHTGRSRNDQVATDIRLWVRAEIDTCIGLLRQLRHNLAALALEHAATILPGFTHLQVAQPVTFGHHLLAYAEMFGRDIERLADCRRRVNRLPLGAAALAGTSYPIDRERVARTLGFDEVCRNSLDAVSDRDFAIEFCADAALVMVHVSRLSEELVLWASPRVGFIELADRFCTGSSIMPQKKNPDVPELARGKTGRVNGHLIALLTLMKGQPLAYNKDNQEDKEGLFDAADTIRDTLTIFADMTSGIRVKPEAMRAAALQGFATATDLADYLVKKGTPFRDAHETVALAVRTCEERGCDLADLQLEELRTFHPSIDADVYEVLTLEGSVASRKHIGGTAPERVRLEAGRILADPVDNA